MPPETNLAFPALRSLGQLVRGTLQVSRSVVVHPVATNFILSATAPEGSPEVLGSDAVLLISEGCDSDFPVSRPVDSRRGDHQDQRVPEPLVASALSPDIPLEPARPAVTVTRGLSTHTAISSAGAFLGSVGSQSSWALRALLITSRSHVPSFVRPAVLRGPPTGLNRASGCTDLRERLPCGQDR
jgi:hypothetical protein